MVGGGRRPSPAKERGGGQFRAKDGFGNGGDGRGARGLGGARLPGGEGGSGDNKVGGSFNALINSGEGSSDQSMGELEAPPVLGNFGVRSPASNCSDAGLIGDSPMVLNEDTGIGDSPMRLIPSNNGESASKKSASMQVDQPRNPRTGRFAAFTGKSKQIQSLDNDCMDTSGDRIVTGSAGPNVSVHRDSNGAEIRCHSECTQGVCSHATKNNTFMGKIGEQPNDFFWERPKDFMDNQNWPELQSIRDKHPSRISNNSESNQLNPQGGQSSWKKKTYDIYDKKEILSDFSTDNGVSVRLDKNAVEVNKLKLQGALVGRLLGRRIPFFFLKRELERRWLQFGNFTTMMVSIDCFMCLFESSSARDAALMGGPWFIAGHIIGLDRWTPKFNPHSLDGFTSPIWVRLPNLPLVCWDKTNIGRIGAAIGEPLWIDSYTSGWGRSAYARICVRADLGKKLPNGVWVIDDDTKFFQPVEYEGISVLCYSCGMVGHREPNCPATQARKTTTVDASATHLQATQTAATTSDYAENLLNEVGNKMLSSTPLRENEDTSNRDKSSTSKTDDHLDNLTDLTSQGLNKGYGPWTTVVNRKKSRRPASQARPPAAPPKLRLLPNDRPTTPSLSPAEQNPFKVPSSPSWEPAQCKKLESFVSNSKDAPGSSKKGKSGGMKKNKKDFVTGKVAHLLSSMTKVAQISEARPSLVMDGQPVVDHSGDFCEVSIRKRKKSNHTSNTIGGDDSPLVT